MSIFNKISEDVLKNAAILSELNNITYKTTGGKKLQNKNFYEGIVNPGTVDIQQPASKITKDMILDYRKKEEERTYKNASGEDVKFQNTGLSGDLLEYKPKFKGDDIDLEGANRDLVDMLKLGNIKEKELRKKINDRTKLISEEARLYKEGRETPAWNLSGRTQTIIKQEIEEIQKAISELEKEINTKFDEFLEIKDEIENQETKIKVIKANIKDNEKEKNIVDKKNREIVKEYGEKFNLLNWQQQQVGQQPNETEEAYIKRLKDLENYKVDPNIYKQKAINENINKLKNNLKEIIKDQGKIDQLVSYFKEGDDAYILNSYWDQISAYLKKYGFDINNKDFNFLKLKEELKAAIENIKKQPFSLNILSKNDRVSNINNAIRVEKIDNNILQLNNYEDNKKLYIKIRANNDHIEYSYDNITYSTFNFKSSKANTKSHYFFSVIKDFNDKLVPNTVDYKKIFGNSDKKKDIHEHLKKQIDVTKTGGGMMEENEEESEQIPKIINFGKIKLLLNKLYYNNILSVKDQKMHSIENMPNKHVSDEFVKVIYNIYNNKSNNEANLSDKELELFHLLLFVSGLSKKKNIDVKRDDNVKKLKERLTLVEAQIKAGNDNIELKEELKQIIKKLHLFKVISLNNAKQYINQF